MLGEKMERETRRERKKERENERKRGDLALFAPVGRDMAWRETLQTQRSALVHHTGGDPMQHHTRETDRQTDRQTEGGGERGRELTKETN
jgi:hypothetical protein